MIEEYFVEEYFVMVIDFRYGIIVYVKNVIINKYCVIVKYCFFINFLVLMYL